MSSAEHNMGLLFRAVVDEHLSFDTPSKNVLASYSKGTLCC
jgi:hypothetical protein